MMRHRGRWHRHQWSRASDPRDGDFLERTAMHYLNFEKAKMQRFLEAIRDGGSLSPSQPRGWSADDMMHVVGAMLFGIINDGPITLPPETHNSGDGPSGSNAIQEQDVG